MVGVAIAHVMFGEPVFVLSQHVRAGPAQVGSEFIATFGLVATIWGCSRARPASTPFAVAAYIVAAYWCTAASTSFANPAVTVARALTNTFTGIRPTDAPGFIAGQLLGAFTAAAFFRWMLSPDTPAVEAAGREVVGG